MLTIVELDDIKDKSKAKLDLPAPLRLGDRIQLSFVLKRSNQGRHEILEVRGEYKITDIYFHVGEQHLKVSATGLAPSWRAIKKEAPLRRRLGPTRFPPTTVS
jgi:hypothetical protein